MPQFFTFGEVREKVKNDLDLIDEDFITQSTMNGFIEEAIDEAESHIHTIYEDYFLTKSTITLETGRVLYPLPSNIYGTKIRKLLYSNGSLKYEIKPVVYLASTIDIQTDEDYAYVLVNPNLAFTADTDASNVITNLISTSDIEVGVAVSGPNIPDGTVVTDIISSTSVEISQNATSVDTGVLFKFGGFHLQFFPTSRERGVITIWYLRQANKPVTTEITEIDNTVVDIPDFSSFVIQYVKMRCYEFEGHPNTVKAIQDVKELRENMVATLTAKVVDENNKIPMDLDFYWDFDYDSYF